MKRSKIIWIIPLWREPLIKDIRITGSGSQ